MVEVNKVDAYIGSRLKKRRELMGLNRTELASRLSLSPECVAAYETGLTRISADNLLPLARCLKTTVGYFFHGLTEPYNPFADLRAANADNDDYSEWSDA